MPRIEYEDAACPKLEFVMRLCVEIADPLELGDIHGNTRRTIPITGGYFEGPLLRGSVLQGGADWQTLRPDGVTVLHALYTLRTDGGKLIAVENRGLRHGPPGLANRIAAGERVSPAEYYFMTTPRFETSAPDLQWLSGSIFVGQAEREKNHVIINVWRVG